MDSSEVTDSPLPKPFPHGPKTFLSAQAWEYTPYLSYTIGVPVTSILKIHACAWPWIHWSGQLTHDLTPQLDSRLLPSWQTHLQGCAWPPLPSWDLTFQLDLLATTSLPNDLYPRLNLATTSGLPLSLTGAVGLAGEGLPCWLSANFSAFFVP